MNLAAKNRFSHLCIVSLAIFTIITTSAIANPDSPKVSLGPRPFYLVDDMDEGALKDKLRQCKSIQFAKTDWSIGHRGAPLQFPEHTAESFRAAARMGAGILECDVTFTRDRELVCRHAQNDLHRTTDILLSPLAERCVIPFTPATGNSKATAECRTADLTLAEFKTLNGKMDAVDSSATTVEDYVDGTVKWRTDLYATTGTVLSHRESIALIASLGAKFTPELKSPVVEMPFAGNYSREAYAQQLIDEYKEAGVDPDDVYPQSFNLDDVLYWIANEPVFGKQAVFLDDSYRDSGWSPMDPATWRRSMASLKALGVNTIAPPMWVLVTVADGKIVPARYAEEAAKAGLNIITWTAERSGPLSGGGGWYYRSMAGVIDNDGDVFNLLQVLHEDVGIKGIFSDWPATTTFYANCFGL